LLNPARVNKVRSQPRLRAVCWRFPQGALLVLGRTSALLWHPGEREGGVQGGQGAKLNLAYKQSSVTRVTGISERVPTAISLGHLLATGQSSVSGACLSLWQVLLLSHRVANVGHLKLAPKPQSYT